MAVKFDRASRIAVLERVLMTGDLVDLRDADALDEMLRELRAESAKPLEIARASAHYPLPGGELSANTATCTIFQNESGNLTRVNVAGEVADFVLERADYDQACEDAYNLIAERYESKDVQWTAEARALAAAMEQVF